MTRKKKALSVIEAIMQTYVAESATVSTLWDMAAPPQQIDRRVKINDAPAFKAFKVLTEHFESISRDAHDDMASASRLQIIFLIASFILLSAVIVTAVLLLRKQTKSIVSMSQAMAEIETHSNFSKRMHDGRKDELGMLTNTFDKLLGNIESMLALNRAVLDPFPIRYSWPRTARLFPATPWQLTTQVFTSRISEAWPQTRYSSERKTPRIAGSTRPASRMARKSFSKKSAPTSLTKQVKSWAASPWPAT